MRPPGTPRWLQPHLAAAEPFARPLPPADPAATALVAVDCQNYFLHPEGSSHLPRSAEMVAALVPVLERMRGLGCPIVFTAHGHADPAVDAGMLGAWWGSAILEGTWEHELLPALGRREDEPVVAKRRYNAFHGTNLEALLRAREVATVVIAGVMTNLCCETTARDAFCRDYRVIFLADGTATADDDLHGAALLNLAFGFAHVTTCAGLLAYLPERA